MTSLFSYGSECSYECTWHTDYITTYDTYEVRAVAYVYCDPLSLVKLSTTSCLPSVSQALPALSAGPSQFGKWGVARSHQECNQPAKTSAEQVGGTHPWFQVTRHEGHHWAWGRSPSLASGMVWGLGCYWSWGPLQTSPGVECISALELLGTQDSKRDELFELRLCIGEYL